MRSSEIKISVVLSLLFLSACGGSSGSSEMEELANSPEAPADVSSQESGVIDSETDSVVEQDSEVESPATLEQQPIVAPEPEAIDEPVPEPVTDTEVSPVAEPEPVTQPEPAPIPDAEQVPPIAIESPSIGFTNATPFCVEAGARIQSSVEIGMTPEDVRSLVGKPLEIDVSGTFWEYGRGGSVPEVRFGATLIDGALAPGVVTEWDTNINSCDNDEDAFIEAANALALEPPGADRTDVVPSCVDAGIRVQAYVELGMTPAEVRSLVGKPVEIGISGTLWDYGQGGSVPEVRFSNIINNGALAPGVVTEFDSRTSSCE